MSKEYNSIIGRLQVELKIIKELMAEMEAKDITKVVIKNEGGEVQLEREKFPAQNFSLSQAHLTPQSADPTRPSDNASHSQKPTQPEIISSKEVTSPMVGTFYSSPSPDAQPFVKVGQQVTEDTIIGIIEAMKVMNEIKAGQSGIVKEVFIENANPVEFGTKLLNLS